EETSISGKTKVKYFCDGIWTGQISLKRLANLVFSRNPFSRHRGISERLNALLFAWTIENGPRRTIRQRLPWACSLDRAGPWFLAGETPSAPCRPPRYGQHETTPSKFAAPLLRALPFRRWTTRPLVRSHDSVLVIVLRVIPGVVQIFEIRRIVGLLDTAHPAGAGANRASR